MVQKKLLIDSAISALEEICFPSIFSEAMLVVLDFLFLGPWNHSHKF